MLVKEFVDGYNNLKKPELKKEWCEKHLKRTYAPLIEKTALLSTLVDSCVMKNDAGILYLNMVCNKMNLTHAIICLYTDLELADPKGDEAKSQVINNYDSFRQYGIIDDFCSLIGDREIDELLSVNGECLNTWHEEHSSSRAFLSELTDKAVRTFVEMAALMKETVTDEDRDKLSETIKGFVGIS